MFIGHFGVALAAKKIAPKTSLGTLILAAQFLDFLWPLFLLLGIEHVRIAPGITRVSPLDFNDYPISHSLLMAIVWAVVFSGTYYALRRNAGVLWWLALPCSVIGCWISSSTVPISSCIRVARYASDWACGIRGWQRSPPRFSALASGYGYTSAALVPAITPGATDSGRSLHFFSLAG